MADDGGVSELPVKQPHQVSRSSYTYPFATSPDIIRANQKDAYFQGVLLEQLAGILRSLKGARFLHTYTTEVRTAADFLYLTLTTFLGNRTLGEEYCDVVSVEDQTGKLPGVQRRAGYIVTSILTPYLLGRLLPVVRRRMRIKLEENLAQRSKRSTASISGTVQSYILENLDTITSPAPIYAVSLAAFYFTGAYYQLSKRIWGLRYIFTRNQPAHSERIGYEVLGVLLMLQVVVQGYLHVRSTMESSSLMARGEMPAVANAASAAGGSAVLDSGVEVSLDPNAYTSNNTLLFESSAIGTQQATEVQRRVARITNTPYTAEPRCELSDTTKMGWLAGRQARKCTLCLEAMRDPSVTTCGHTFCWSCIMDWLREKAECPLCRQNCLTQHVLPLRA